MSKSLGPDQARRFIGPDLGPNYLQRLSADDTGRQRHNDIEIHFLQFSIQPYSVGVSLGASLGRVSNEHPHFLMENYLSKNIP